MKKVLSMLLVVFMSISRIAVSANAETESCPFVKVETNLGDTTFMVLRADGALYQLYPKGNYYRIGEVEDYAFDLEETGVDDVILGYGFSFFKKNNDYPVYFTDVEEYGETIRFERMVGENLFQTSGGDIFKLYGKGAEYQFTTDAVKCASNEYLLTVSGKLYYDDELVAENVLDFCDYGSGHTSSYGYGSDSYGMYYRKADGNLYLYTRNNQKSTLVMTNCSSLYNYAFARDNNGNWYHTGYNAGNCLEPQKFVDGNNITPERFDDFVKASEYVYKTRNLEWKLDGHVYLNGELLVQNVIHVGAGSSVSMLTESGEVFMLFEAEYNHAYEYAMYGDFTNTGLVMKDPVDTIRRNGPNMGAFVTKDGGLGIINASFNGEKEFYSAYEVKGSRYLTRSDWAAAELAAADAIGFIDSVKNNEVRKNITRMQFCEMIVAFAEAVKGEALPSVSKNPFEDVNDENKEAILKAYAGGIIAGISATEFNPDGNITREQMCAIMTRTIQYLNPSVAFGEPIHFTDMASVSDWAVEGVNAMSAMGIVKGDGVSINPQSHTTIEQAVAMTYRLYGKVK